MSRLAKALIVLVGATLSFKVILNTSPTSFYLIGLGVIGVLIVLIFLFFQSYRAELLSVEDSDYSEYTKEDIYSKLISSPQPRLRKVLLMQLEDRMRQVFKEVVDSVESQSYSRRNFR